MVVQRGHQENPTPLAESLLGVLEVGHLQHYRQILNQENARQNGNQEFFADGNSEHGNDSANGQAAGIPHKNLSGEGVVPQEPNARPQERCRKNHQFACIGDLHNVQVRRKYD
jgi:hypothetical protein